MDRTDIETLVGALEEYLDLGARAEPLELEGLRDMIGRARRLVAGQPRDWVLVLRPPESKVAPPAEKSSSFAQEGEGGSAGAVRALLPEIEEALARSLEQGTNRRLMAAVREAALPLEAREVETDPLEEIGAILADWGCDCACSHGFDEHEAGCRLCLGCRISAVVFKAQRRGARP